ncbi:MAG: hypothetical protein WDN06_12480 [Asticcacaulis sp.]
MLTFHSRLGIDEREFVAARPMPASSWASLFTIGRAKTTTISIPLDDLVNRFGSRRSTACGSRPGPMAMAASWAIIARNSRPRRRGSSPFRKNSGSTTPTISIRRSMAPSCAGSARKTASPASTARSRASNRTTTPASSPG